MTHSHVQCRVQKPFNSSFIQSPLKDTGCPSLYRTCTPQAQQDTAHSRECMSARALIWNHNCVNVVHALCDMKMCAVKAPTLLPCAARSSPCALTSFLSTFLVPAGTSFSACSHVHKVLRSSPQHQPHSLVFGLSSSTDSCVENRL